MIQPGCGSLSRPSACRDGLDFTQNKYANTNTGYTSSNDSAEFIVERNGMSNCSKWPFYCVALANYGDYYIHDAKYQLANTNWYVMDGSLETFWVWNLENSSGQFLEYNEYFGDSSGASHWDEIFHQGS